MSDKREHKTDGQPCWCGPQIIREGGADVIVHRQIPACPGCARLEDLCLESGKATHNDMLAKDNWESFTPDCLPDLVGWLYSDRMMCVNHWNKAKLENDKLSAEITEQVKRAQDAEQRADAFEVEVKELKSRLDSAGAEIAKLQGPAAWADPNNPDSGSRRIIDELKAELSRKDEALKYFIEADCDGAHEIPRNTDGRGLTIAQKALDNSFDSGQWIAAKKREARTETLLGLATYYESLGHGDISLAEVRARLWMLCDEAKADELRSGK